MESPVNSTKVDSPASKSTKKPSIDSGIVEGSEIENSSQVQSKDNILVHVMSEGVLASSRSKAKHRGANITALVLHETPNTAQSSMPPCGLGQKLQGLDLECSGSHHSPALTFGTKHPLSPNFMFVKSPTSFTVGEKASRPEKEPKFLLGEKFQGTKLLLAGEKARHSENEMFHSFSPIEESILYRNQCVQDTGSLPSIGSLPSLGSEYPSLGSFGEPSSLEQLRLPEGVEALSSMPTGVLALSTEELSSPKAGVAQLVGLDHHQAHLGGEQDLKGHLAEKEAAIIDLQAKLNTATVQADEVKQVLVDMTARNGKLLASREAEIERLESAIKGYKVKIANLERLSRGEQSDIEIWVRNLEAEERRRKLELAEARQKMAEERQEKSDIENVDLKEKNAELKASLRHSCPKKKFLESVVWLDEKIAVKETEIRELKETIESCKLHLAKLEKKNHEIKVGYEKQIAQLKAKLKDAQKACNACAQSRERAVLAESQAETVRAKEQAARAKAEAALTRLAMVDERRQKLESNYKILEQHWRKAEVSRRRAEEEVQKVREQNAELAERLEKSHSDFELLSQRYKSMHIKFSRTYSWHTDTCLHLHCV